MDRNIRALTGLRFFAAMAIVLTHSGVPSGPLFYDGAVALFFVLSGFVLTLNADKYRSWPKFMRARIARIWPAHLAALAFAIVIYWPTLDKSGTVWRRLLWNIFLLQAWSLNPDTFFSFNSVSWSLSVEMALYAIFSFCLRDWRRLAALTAICLIAAPVLDLPGPNPIAAFPSFAFGIIAGLIYQRTGRIAESRGWMQFAALILAFAANALCRLSHFSNTPLYGAAPAYAVLILSLARYDGALSRFLSLPIVVYGGEISYSLYLFHQPLIRILYEWPHHKVPLPFVWLLSLTVAAFSYATVERWGKSAINGGWLTMFRGTVRKSPL